MEVLSFYGLNIIVGSLLAVLLGLFGIHCVGRKKSLEVLMTAQTMQLGLIFGAFLSAVLLEYIEFMHNGHLGLLFSLLVAGGFYIIYQRLSLFRNYLRTELALVIIIVSISLTHIFTALNPLVESHFTRSFVGDIVTASRVENIIVVIFCLLIGFIFKLNYQKIWKQTLDFALFDFSLRKKYYLFEWCLFLLMCFSIHIFGLLFTLAMILVPICCLNFLDSFSIKKMQIFIGSLNFICVVLGFLVSLYSLNLPTSPIIVGILVLIYGSFIGVMKILNYNNS